MKARYAKLTEVFKKTADLAVNKGNKETYHHFHARLLQCQKEVKDMITAVTDGAIRVICVGVVWCDREMENEVAVRLSDFQ
eukprot:scaffold24319_cov124-Skeletonema_marinoi.AAC.2